MRRACRFVPVLPALAAIVLAPPDGGAQAIRFGGNRIVLTASPGRLPADGQTASRIRIEVRGRDDAPVPDGSAISVSTDIGDLTTEVGSKTRWTSVQTEGGYALILLTSEEPGTATVTAQYQTSRNQIMVEFLPPGEAGKRESRVVHVMGGWVGYCTDLDLIEARSAELRYQGLVIEADTLQLNPSTLVVKADGVKLKRRDQELDCEDTYLELSTMRGCCRRIGDMGVEEIRYNAFTLQPTDAEQTIPPDAFHFDDREGRVWTKARSASLFPGEKIVLRNASLYVDQHLIMRYPPYWVVAFEGYRGSSNTQFLQFDSTGGLALDFPIFFSVTDTSTGALKIQRGASSSSVMAREGWSLALEFTDQDVARERETSLVIDGIPRDDIGVLFRDSRKLFGGSDADLSIAWPDHRNLFTDFSVLNYGSAGHLAVRTYADRTELGDFSYGLNGDFLSNPTPWGRDVNFRWGTGFQAGHDPWDMSGFTFEHRVSTYLDLKAWKPAESTSIVPSISDVFTWDTDRRRYNTARFQLSLNQRLARGVAANLRYSLEHRAGESQFDVLDSRDGINQQLNLNVSAFASKRWDAYVNASYGVTDGTVYGFSALNYRPWRQYRLGVIGTYYKFSDTAFSDLEVSFNRALGNREVGVRYSTADGRVSLQFGAAQF
jgi:hypothetical protein